MAGHSAAAPDPSPSMRVRLSCVPAHHKKRRGERAFCRTIGNVLIQCPSSKGRRSLKVRQPLIMVLTMDWRDMMSSRIAT